MSAFIGLTTKKKIAAAVAVNVMAAVMNAPYPNTASLIVNVSPLKSGLPMIIAMIGMIRSSTNEAMSAAKASPITNATASSTRLPRRRKSRNSLTMKVPAFRSRRILTCSARS